MQKSKLEKRKIFVKNGIWVNSGFRTRAELFRPFCTTHCANGTSEIFRPSEKFWNFMATQRSGTEATAKVISFSWPHCRYSNSQFSLTVDFSCCLKFLVGSSMKNWLLFLLHWKFVWPKLPELFVIWIRLVFSTYVSQKQLASFLLPGSLLEHSAFWNIVWSTILMRKVENWWIRNARSYHVSWHAWILKLIFVLRSARFVFTSRSQSIIFLLETDYLLRNIMKIFLHFGIWILVWHK